MHLTSHRSHKLERIAGGTNHQIARLVKVETGDLTERQIHLRFYRNIESHLAHVSDNSDNRDPREVVLAKLDSLPYCALIGPILASHCFIDDHDGLRVLIVAVLNVTSLAQCNSHRLEIIRADLPVDSIGRNVGWWLWSFENETVCPAFPLQRHRRGIGRRDHAGQRPGSREHIVIEGPSLRRLLILALQHSPHGQQFFRLKNRKLAAEVRKRLDQETRTNEQYERQRNLSDHERTAQSAA